MTHFRYLLHLCLHCLSEIMDHFHGHIWILFQSHCLTPLHLVVLLGFYLVPSIGTYFSADSFCLTFCVCGLLFSGRRCVVMLASGICLCMIMVQRHVQAS